MDQVGVMEQAVEHTSLVIFSIYSKHFHNLDKVHRVRKEGPVDKSPPIMLTEVTVCFKFQSFNWSLVSLSLQTGHPP